MTDRKLDAKIDQDASDMIDRLMLLAKWEITKGTRPNSHGHVGDSRGGSLKVKNDELVEWKAELKFNGSTIPEILAAVKWHDVKSGAYRFVEYADTKRSLSDLGLCGAIKFFRDTLIDFAEFDKLAWDQERQQLAKRLDEWVEAAK